MKTLRVTAIDLETGDEETQEIGPGNYVVITTEPLYLDGYTTYANGTVVLTLKRDRSKGEA